MKAFHFLVWSFVVDAFESPDLVVDDEVLSPDFSSFLVVDFSAGFDSYVFLSSPLVAALVLSSVVVAFEVSLDEVFDAV